MRRNTRISLFLAVGCLALLGGSRTAFAITDDQPEANAQSNPYSVIVDRNVFRLNPPPPPPDPNADAKPVDLPQYKLTGIVNISGQTRVLFALTPKDAKEQPTYLNLVPGERQGQLELVSIDRDKEEVAVINSGTPMTLSVRSNSYVSSGATPPAGPSPGGRRLPGFPAPPNLVPPPAPAPAQAAAPSGGGAIIIGGGGNSGGSNSGGDNSGYSPVTQNNYAPGSGIYTGGGSSSGVSVGGSSPVNVGGATIATPNGSVALNLNSSAPSQNIVNPTPEPASPAEQAAALLAASEGLDGNGKQTQTSSSGSQYKGPPMLPVKGLGPPTPP